MFTRRWMRLQLDTHCIRQSYLLSELRHSVQLELFQRRDGIYPRTVILRSLGWGGVLFFNDLKIQIIRIF